MALQVRTTPPRRHPITPLGTLPSKLKLLHTSLPLGTIYVIHVWHLCPAPLSPPGDIGAISRSLAASSHALAGRAVVFASAPFLRALLSIDTCSWESVRPLVASLLSTGAIFGIYLGDELIWNGLPPADLEAVASLVRRDFPSVVIWVNEARPPLKNGLTQFQHRLPKFVMPASISWVSTDSYHFEPNPNHVAETRRFYHRYIYPKLLPNQSAVLVPGAFASEHNPG